MGAQNRGYMKIECPDCGRYIGRNNFASLHQPKCRPYQERMKRERMERLKTAPIASLGMGEAQEAGRWDEFVQFVNG